MALLLVLILGLVFGYLSSQIALAKGRNVTVWFLIGFLFTWLGLVLALIIPPTAEARERMEEEAKLSQDELDESGPLIEVSPPLSREAVQQREWFYLDEENQQQGPTSFAELQQLWRERKIKGSSYVWADGMHDWQQVRTHAALKDLLGR